eukprot:COSAG02_NODE_1451_length_12556_cov_3.624258_4_plen_814_part_00
MGAKKRRGQQMVAAAEIRRPSEEFHSELIPVEISLGCDDLPILQATGSCLSVFAVLWVRKQGNERWQEHGRTEVVRSGSAPQFARSFFLDYLDHDDVLRNEEYDTWLRVELFQHTGTTVADLEKQKRCGWVETTLRELYRTPIKQMALDLRLSRSSVIKHGALDLRIADAPRDTLQPFVEFSLAAALGKAGRGAKSTGASRSAATGEYFVTCHRYTHGGVFELFYRTERARPATSSAAGASVSFGAVKQSLQRCCFGKHDTFLRYELWQEDKLGFHQKLGSIDTTLAEMLEAQTSQKAADKRSAKDDEEATNATEKPDVRKEGRRRRRAATPGGNADVTMVQYDLKAPKSEKDDDNGPKWVMGSMGALPLDERAAAQLPVLMLHAELFSSTAPDEDAAAASGIMSTSASVKAGRKEKKASQTQLKRVAGLSAATASAEFGGDLDFLKELLDDTVVSESDVKDIVGDGIRYLHERHHRSSTTTGRGHKNSKARGGAGYFLDGAEGSRGSGAAGRGSPGMKLKPPRSTKASQGHAMLLRLAAVEEKAAASSPQADKRRRRRRPKSTPAGPQDGSPNHDADETDRPQTEGGGARLPSIRTGGNLRVEARAAEAKQKHAQRRSKQAEADSRRSVKLGDRGRFVNALRSDESTRTMTGQAVAALEDEERQGRFMMQPPAPGVYAALQQQSKSNRGSRGSNGGRRSRGRAALAERAINSATIERLATPQKRAMRVSEQKQKQRQHRRSSPFQPGRCPKAREARRAPVDDYDYVDDDDFDYSSEDDWESRPLGDGPGRFPDKLPSVRASFEAEEVEERLG